MSITVTLLEDAIRALATEGEWEKYLKVQSRFRSYSARNGILIARQCPGATQVAGYRTWQSLDRQVVKGSRAIKIVAPIEHANGSVSFRTVSVFDISQTSGARLPVTPQLLLGDDPVGLFDALVEVASGYNFIVSQGELPDGINGLCSHLGRTIAISNSLSARHQAKTLAHELSHAYLHGEPGTTRAIAEFEAESVAYLVCHAFGIESASYSFSYITQWAGGPNQALEAILASGERIRTTAEMIVNQAQNLVGHDAAKDVA
ncbi:ImmA/IrrE family metallo-endopeptidase [Ferrimicrobium acidiphilum]|uniref:ImmA/IrrE family metallo-endopeptidase n=1 Tax=Ferrimicrobium acidiphilum TaxID=121039 RepID=UPI0023F05793|nr:ImmA/IrrE family metallo-endopeptidase [Ferrimicrobium acidiphilum]